MSYTDGRDFDPELTVTIDGLKIEIEKAGGGTVGLAYDGSWFYRITDSKGAVVDAGYSLDGLTTGMPHTHRWVAEMLAQTYYGGE